MTITKILLLTSLLNTGNYLGNLVSRNSNVILSISCNISAHFLSSTKNFNFFDS